MKPLLVATALLLSSCAATPPPAPNNAGGCGDPCATRSCPSAFVCVVDASCAARCQAEPVKPGFP